MSDNIIQAAVANSQDRIWPVPNLSILNVSRRKAPEMPLESFGHWAPWIERCAEHCSAPVDYGVAGLISTASTLLGNTRWVAPWDGWSEPPVLWLSCVGNPSSGKTPALKPLLRIIDEFEGEYAVTFESKLLQFEADKAAAKVRREKWQDEVATAVGIGTAPPLPPNGMNDDEPECPRIKVNDSTIERLAMRLAAEPKGIMLLRDELAGWLGNLEKFGPGDRAFWIEAYNGGGYAVDRVKHGNKPIRVPYLSVSVLGGIQPDSLQRLLVKGDDDGLAARFLMVWPEPTLPKRPRGTLDTQWALAKLRKIMQIQMPRDENGHAVPSYVPMSDKAADLFHEWRLEAAKKEEGASGLYLSHLGKVPGLTARLSIILQYLDWAALGGDEPNEISDRSVGYAAHLIDTYFIPMAERTYGSTTLPKAEQKAVTIARCLHRKNVQRFNAVDMRRTWGLSGIREAADTREALEVLCELHIVNKLSTRSGGTPGRGRDDYLVNPRFLEAVL